jgi:hypothetical protein
MALGSRLPALRDDYKLGRLCGRYFLATVGKLLAEKPPLIRHAPRVATTSATIVVPPAAVANDAVDTPLVSAVQANDLPFNNEDTA